MLTLNPLEVHHPTTVDEAVHLKETLYGSLYLAGGTDLLPNLKQGLHDSAHLISLDALSLSEVRLTDDALILGSGLSLHALNTHPLIQREAPALSNAAGLIAGPQHRRMGTLGGNILLDTRCLFYNQSQEWREALGFCLKREGSLCHVLNSTRSCVAAQSSDTVPNLVAREATLHFASPKSNFQVPLQRIFNKDGRFDRRLALPPHSLLLSVSIPRAPPGHRELYQKIRSREAIDFPSLSLAYAATFNGDLCTSLSVVIGAVMPQPKVLSGLNVALGTPLNDPIIETIAQLGVRQIRPQATLHADIAWRREQVRVQLIRGLQQLRVANP